MNSQTTLLIASILAFALFANVSAPVFATGGLDDEEEEEAIKKLQNQIDDITDTLGTIKLNLTEGSNDITANCPSTEEIVKEVVENITNNNNNNKTTEAAQPPTQNTTCPTIPEIEENVTEVIEEIIQNVTEQPPSTCNIPQQQQQQQQQEIIPGIVLPNVTETPVEVEKPVQNETSDLEPIICPINGELLGYTNTTSGEQLPISAGQELGQQELALQPTIQDEQEIATIEFESSCGCFVVDKSPEEVQ